MSRENVSMEKLENTMSSAIVDKAKYIAIAVLIEGAKDPEIIINLTSNFKSKMDYYKKAYNEDLCLKANQTIKIVDFTYSNSLSIIESDLLGV